MQDEEPLPDHLRCKRTDGKQWRCNRRVMEDKKLCELHHLQGRHRQNREKVPESLKIQRKDRKIFKVQQRAEIRAQRSKKLKKKKKKQRVIGESEALDEALKKMKLKRGDLQLELIRMVLKREVEKRKRQNDCDGEDEANCDNSNNSDSDGEFTRELPNGLMAISSTNSDNAGPSCAVKIEADATAVNRRRFRSKNIEPIPIGTLQVVPYKRDVVNLRKRKRCHWCRRRGESLIKCLNCRKLFFCVDCVKEWYFDTQEDVKKACPVCRGTCSCKACSSSQYRDIDYKDLLRANNEVEKVLHFHYLICMLLPVVKQINQYQSVELEKEAKIKGQNPSEVQIQEAEFMCDSQCCCSSCKTSIVDFHRSCVSCSYTLCLSCCQDIFRGRLSGSVRAHSLKCLNGQKVCPSVVRLLENKSLSTYNQGYGSTFFDSSALLPSWKATDASAGILCPPTEFGGCGDSFLDLRCVFPFSWTKELESSAEQIVGCYELPETIDVSSCCSVCTGMDHEVDGTKQLKGAATRENSNDNFLFYPTLLDVQGDKIEHFQKHWRKGQPIIVRNMLQGTDLSWDPLVLFCTYLKNSAPRSENDEGAFEETGCSDWFEVEIGVKQLFLGSLRGPKHADVCNEKLKLKGWLSSRLFQEHFAAHYAEFIRGLPLPEYMDPKSGVLNIATKLPLKIPTPDLGPCVYISYGSGEELAQADSVTKLCYDLCDVVNVLAHTTDVPVSTVQLNKIRELMQGHMGQYQKDSPEVAPEQKMAIERQKSSFDGENMENGVCDVLGEEITPHEVCDLNLRDRNSCQDEDYDTDTDSDPDPDSSILGYGTIRSSKKSERRKHFKDWKSNSNYFIKERLAESCGAQWDVFRREDVPKLIEYLRRHSDQFPNKNGFQENVVHPILDQNFFLDATHKMRLKQEFEIEPWTFEQHVGEAVIVPAGCPYQIRNLKSCVNVVLDFISPENVTHCIQLIDEIRLLPADHKAKANKFEVTKMALYGVSSAVKEIRELTCAE